MGHICEKDRALARERSLDARPPSCARDADAHPVDDGRQDILNLGPRLRPCPEVVAREAPPEPNDGGPLRASLRPRVILWEHLMPPSRLVRPIAHNIHACMVPFKARPHAMGPRLLRGPRARRRTPCEGLRILAKTRFALLGYSRSLRATPLGGARIPSQLYIICRFAHASSTGPRARSPGDGSDMPPLPCEWALCLPFPSPSWVPK